MTPRAEHIAELLQKHLEGQLSAVEKAEWETWQGQSPRVRALAGEFADPQQVAAHLRQLYAYDQSGIESKIKGAFPGLSLDKNEASFDGPKAAHIQWWTTTWFRWAAAIIILCGIGTYMFTHTSQPDKEVVIDQPSPKSNDVAPGYNRAVLTLSDGRKVAIDSAAAETITDGTLTITNRDGGLSYQNAEVVAVNTMSTPKGGQYQLTLADGTKVWLNAASSITFPTAFKGSTREVSIEGEAYFEVTQNKLKPFIVKTNREKIVVLGTSFNIHRYNDEPAGKISLMEGAIRVGDTNIKPGQAYSNGKVIKTDIKRDIAWKNGYFNFEGADLPAVMRQLGRWYDIEVKFEREIPKRKFRGELPRNLTLTQVLNVLRDININFEIKDKTLLVK